MVESKRRTLEAGSPSQGVYVDGGHLHPGEMGGRGFEAVCWVEGEGGIIGVGHGFILGWFVGMFTFVHLEAVVCNTQVYAADRGDGDD